MANGNDGADQIWIESTLWLRDGNASVNKPAEINGGIGHDTLTGGDGTDTIHGGDGDDFIYNSDGADLLYGDGDKDYMSGGAGNDTMYGGSGNDYLEDHPSNDHDHLFGEAGDDGINVFDWDTNDLMDGGGNTPIGDSEIGHDQGDTISAMEN